MGRLLQATARIKQRSGVFLLKSVFSILTPVSLMLIIFSLRVDIYTIKHLDVKNASGTLRPDYRRPMLSASPGSGRQLSPQINNLLMAEPLLAAASAGSHPAGRKSICLHAE